MADLSLDLNPNSGTYKDLLIVDGDLVLTSDVDPAGTDPVLQNVLQNLGLGLGEWFLDSTAGIPWLQQILVKNPDQSKIDAILRNCILGTPGIVRLNSYSFSLDQSTRSGQIQFNAQKTNGTVDYSGTVISGGGVNG